ncbi:MAG: hypothetical protein ACFFDN_17920 [Candidatus Hodarchaeota archaeon]
MFNHFNHFLEIPHHKRLGIDLKTPFVEPAENKYAKMPWKKIKVSGKVEKDFIYATILSGDIGLVLVLLNLQKSIL